MSIEFSAELPNSETLRAAAATDTTNPFLTHAYACAMQRLMYQPSVFMLREGGRVIAACFAFMKSGRLSRTLEIPSLPALPGNVACNEFWAGVREYCRCHRITHVEASSFASASTDIPPLPGEIARRTRFEYVLDLQHSTELSSNHMRNIRRARNAGVTIRHSKDDHAYGHHLQLVEASFERRRERGEEAAAGDLAKRIAALCDAGAGEFFQASIGAEVVSSIFVLLAERGAYYQSAGTSREGMECGASHLLVGEIARELRDRGMTIFNLGGADDSSDGLRRFKTGFGTRPVQLPAARFFWGNLLTKTMTAAARLLRNPQHGSPATGRE
jgi:hypothetical protein